MRLRSVFAAILVTAGLGAGDARWEPAVAATFTRPLWVGTIPGDRDHLMVIEQGGRVLRIADAATAAAPSVLLDLAAATRTDAKGYSEEGLLAWAFHPRFAEHGRVFAWWMPSGGQRRTELIELRMAVRAPFVVDPASRRTLLSVPQPYSNHNGGDLAFGPDGMLYIAVGDGGSAGDPKNLAQDPGSLLGKILRLDVADPAGVRVPADNPFAGRDGWRREIWALGLRNVWRMAFDADGRLWAADVGQNTVEEIDLIERGGNYGWRAREGFRPFKEAETRPGMIEPVLEYGRQLGTSVTGGFVYAGADLPGLRGRYLFGDWGSGRTWSVAAASATHGARAPLREEARVDGMISSFGRDQRGEPLAVEYRRGVILRLRP